MAIGRREQIVFISIGALAAIFLTHVLVFKPRADEYARIKQEYDTGINQLQGAEIPRSPNELLNYQNKTTEYQEQVTSVVAQLSLEVPPLWVDKSGEANTKKFVELANIIGQLVKLRETVQRPTLSFMGDRRQNPADPTSMQMGWNLPTRLPDVGAAGALWDRVVQLEQTWVLMNTVSNMYERITAQRPRYNQRLALLGINPFEVSDYIAPDATRTQWVPFNDPAGLSIQGAQVNRLSINRFGPMLPSLKKFWFAELIWAQRDPSSKLNIDRLRAMLEVNLPYDNNLLITVKQFQALIDIIELAQKDGVLEIYQVNLLKPVPLGKAVVRVEGQTPAPSASPTPVVPQVNPGMAGGAGLGGEVDPLMAEQGLVGMDPIAGVAMPASASLWNPKDKIGEGTGLEIYFRATNPVMVQFLFDITNTPRTYALDDLHVQASPDGVLNTSATVEIVTNLDSLAAKK